MGTSTDLASRKHSSASMADINKTKVSNLGANKLPPKNALFRLWKKKAFFETPFDTCLFMLSHKLNCALFVVFYQPLTIPRKTIIYPYLRRHLSTACSAKRHFRICHYDNSQKRGRTLHPSISAERLKQQGDATCPTTSATLNGI